MTTLLIQSAASPMTINLPSVASMSLAQFYEFCQVCPDFVIELRSASDSMAHLQDKMQEYQTNGALLGWLIDRKQRRLYIYRPHREPEILENPVSVSGDPELPGFVLRMEKIW